MGLDVLENVKIGIVLVRLIMATQHLLVKNQLPIASNTGESKFYQEDLEILCWKLLKLEVRMLAIHLLITLLEDL